MHCLSLCLILSSGNSLFLLMHPKKRMRKVTHSRLHRPRFLFRCVHWLTGDSECGKVKNGKAQPLCRKSGGEIKKPAQEYSARVFALSVRYYLLTEIPSPSSRLDLVKSATRQRGGWHLFCDTADGVAVPAVGEAPDDTAAE